MQSDRAKSIVLNPPTLTLLALLLLVAVVIFKANGDPLALARIGTRYELSDPNGTQGYDGQFVYYIARNPDPKIVASQLDVPAYRYQRILMPLLARLISLGNNSALPWVLASIGILAQVAGTWAVAELLAQWKISRWYALIYGLWAGFALAVRLDLPEPLAYSLVAGALLAGERKHPVLSWILFSLALFAKEVTLVFLAAAVLSALLKRNWGEAAGLVGVGVVPYVIYQGWLWAVFGQPGIGSGGAMATGFEIIPFMGLLRIGVFSPLYLVAMLLVFGPAVVLPSIWGVWAAVKKFLIGETNVVVLALFLNCLAVAFLPFSTFRETGGTLRFVSGLVLAVLLFASRYRYRRVLNYSFLWLVLNVFLVKSGG